AMRSLLAFAFFAAASATAAAADKPEDLAKEAAVAFVKAVKARNVDDAVKLTGTPFLLDDAGKTTLVEKADEVKEKLKAQIEKLKDTDRIVTDVVEVVPAAKVKDKFGAKADKDDFAKGEKAMGKDGFVVVFGRNGDAEGGVLVAMKDGKAKIVGIPK